MTNGLRPLGEGGGECGGEGGEDPPGLPPLPVVEQWTDREYVYGPDYVDEFVAQFDRDGRPMLMLQDGNFNVVALVAGADDVFFDASTNGLPAGSVLEQYVYDPYGGVRQADAFAEHAVNRVGHQGLFFDRFDGDWEHAGLAPGAVGLYYNRNRVYSPPSLRNVGDAENPDWRLVGLGRFISSDPNETALTLVSALAMNGESLGAGTSAGFDLAGNYRDGMNLYAYISANPVTSRDPLGLEGDWDDFDEAIDDLMGHRVAAIGYLHEGSGWAIAGMQTSLEIAGSFLGMDLLESAGAIASNTAGFWDYVEIAMRVAPIIGPAASTAWKVVAKANKWSSRQIENAVRGSRFASKVASNRGRIPGLCFAAGTLVATCDGPVPIEAIKPGDCVISWDATRGEAREDRVCATHCSWTTELLVIRTLDCEVLVTASHPFLTEGYVWKSAADIALGTALFSAEGWLSPVVSKESRPGLARVYTLDVEEADTYCVGLPGLVVHNGSPADEFASAPGYAVNKALDWLAARGVTNLTEARVGRMGGVGMATPDGKSGYRIEWDSSRGAHINVWHGKEKGPHIRFPGNKKSVDNLIRRLFCR